MLHSYVDKLMLIMPYLAESEHTAPACIAGNESRDATSTALVNLGGRLVSGASGNSMSACWEGRGVVVGE